MCWTEEADIDADAYPAWYQEVALEPAETAAPQLKLRPLPVPTVRAVDFTVEASAESEPALLLTIVEAAKRLHVGRCTMQQLVLQEEVRSFKIGKLRRIPPEALDEYIARRMQP